MEADKYSVVISPENLSSDLVKTFYSANTSNRASLFPCSDVAYPSETQIAIDTYTGLTYILSGGTGGTSLLTGLTIPVVFTQTYNDIGYYSEFDGLMYQNDIVTNFLYSGANQSNPFEVVLYNTSGDFTLSYLDFTTYIVDWGDGQVTPLTTQFLNHSYVGPGNYTITMSGSNPWGVTIIQKPITIPLISANVPNPNGDITFVPQQGNWADIPVSYQYIYPFDSDNTISAQISSNFTTIPFSISGFTTSKIQDLKRWGPNPFTPGFVFTKNNQLYGQIDSFTPEYTAYTINNINYFDLVDGTTFYIINSSGITQNDIVASAITKNEYLLDFVMAPELQTDAFVERGKYSPFEGLQRLGEVDNIGDLVRYGYGYFNIRTT